MHVGLHRNESLSVKRGLNAYAKSIDPGNNMGTMGGGGGGEERIAGYEQFLLFPQCFQKTCTADT